MFKLLPRADSWPNSVQKLSSDYLQTVRVTPSYSYHARSIQNKRNRSVNYSKEVNNDL